MEKLIPIINKLQDVFATLDKRDGIDLPQIAVVGSQSVGKSSVLENLVGKDFLPRGSGVVTRAPLVLKLINIINNNDNNNNNNIDDIKTDNEIKNDNNNNNDNIKPYGSFSHLPNKIFYDFNDIRNEIQNRTNEIAGKNGVSSQTINLTVYSSDVLNLTLVDLPGLTSTAIKGQNESFPHEIRKLVKSFIKHPRCIILAVSSATEDLANSSAIQIAKEVDPNMLRTLGVLTKIDLMDEGTNALQILSNKTIPLKLGYVGVVNRSQKDINNNKNIKDALKSEEIFFKTNKNYKSISHLCGVPYLAKKLNQILINHIKKTLPKLKQEIEVYINDLESEVLTYGEPIHKDNKGALLLHLIHKFCENFTNAIDGKDINQLIKQNEYKKRTNFFNNNYNQSSQLFGGARILYIFKGEYKKDLYKVKPFEGLSDLTILNAMRNSSGIRSSLFIPEICFEDLVKMQIEKLRKPSLRCVELVYDELRRISSQSQTPDIVRFDKFKMQLNDCINNLLKTNLSPCKDFVNTLIDIQVAYINTNNPDFISMDEVMGQQREQPNNDDNNNDNNNNNNNNNNVNNNDLINDNDNINDIKTNDDINNHNNIDNHNGNNKLKSKQSKAHTQANSSSSFSFSLFNAKHKPKQISNNNDIKKREQERLRQQREHQLKLEQQKREQDRIYNQKKKRLLNDTYKINAPNATKREALELRVIKELIKSYFEIVRKEVFDLVPKTIMHQLVNHSKSNLQQHLSLKLYKQESFEQLLMENPEIETKRNETKNLLNILKKALDIIHEVKDFKIL